MALSAALAGCSVQVQSRNYAAREEKRFTVRGAPEVTLSTFDGSIEVRSWDRDEVLVEIEKTGASQEQVDGITVVAEQEGDRVRVEARQPAAGWELVGVERGARLVATLPERCNLLARSSDGSLQAERLTGRIELRSGDGSVRAIDVGGDLVIDTRDGSVKVDGARGSLDARTGDGSITAAGQLAAVNLKTGDGTVSLTVEPGSVMSGGWDLSTSDGSIALYLPEAFDAEIDARTRDGSLRFDRGMTDAEVGRDGSAREARATFGRGGQTITVRTRDGSIGIRRR
jgi:hypothetical protein